VQVSTDTLRNSAEYVDQQVIGVASFVRDIHPLIIVTAIKDGKTSCNSMLLRATRSDGAAHPDAESKSQSR